MKYYVRRVTKRAAINHFGKLGYVPCYEFFKCNKPEFVEVMNKGKRVKYEECESDKFIKFCRKLPKANTVVSIKLEDFDND